MSADMMVICKEFDSSYRGKNTDKALFIDETSLGIPWTEFGGWFGERFCGHPGIMEQLQGITEHDYTLFTDADFAAVEAALQSMEHRENLTADDFRQFIGNHISTENW